MIQGYTQRLSRGISSILFIASFAFIFVLMPTTAQAYSTSQSMSQLKTALTNRSAAASTRHVTIMILDMSGSMADNDPQGLRCSAANAFISLSRAGEYIGVVGLDNNNATTESRHNFLAAQSWANPAQMDVLAARQQLQATINNKSANCRPDGSTPTYDALAKALDMLKQATQGQQDISGSVILLTDGIPAPNPDQQVADINSELVPQFKQNNWPIDTVALGKDLSFRSFLQTVSTTTLGKFYDDAKGDVPGVSPLNIAPFFLDILARRNGRTVTRDIAPTPLDGGQSRSNFPVIDFTQNLDVVVVKEQPNTVVTLKQPDGSVITNSGSTFISTDPHYFIFSIDQPQAGQWELDVSGSGQFEMYSFKKSDIKVSIASPSAQRTVYPLGQAIPIIACLSNNGTPITDAGGFTLIGNLSYGSDTTQGQYQQALRFQPKSGAHCSGATEFQANPTVPYSAPAGTYNVQVSVTGASATDIISTDYRSVGVELFPEPLFFSSQNEPTANTVTTNVVRWDPLLQLLYGWRLAPITALSNWPLNGTAATPKALFNGRILAGNQPYSNAVVTAIATLKGSKQAVTVDVFQDGGGRFHVLFPSVESGTYQVQFTTTGNFKDTHGELSTVMRTVLVNVAPATFGQEIGAWTKTLLYLALALFLYLLVRFFLISPPFGEWVRLQAANAVDQRGFSRVRRDPISAFVSRNVVNSRQVGLASGLQFRFRRGNVIETRASGRGANEWQLTSGDKVPSEFRAVNGVVHSGDGSLYTISTQQARGEDDYGGSSGGGKYDMYGDDSYGYGDAPAQPAKKAPRFPLPQPKNKKGKAQGSIWDDNY